MEIKPGALFHTPSSMLLWKITGFDNDFIVARTPFMSGPAFLSKEDIIVYAECSRCYPKAIHCQCKEEHND